jgi:DNA invertase Pin-like site-specific DNA recombinase
MTMTQKEALQGIRRAAKRRERADHARRDATAELWDYCREAKAAGVSISQIAREAGLSRQGVYDLLGDRRPSQQT